MVNPDEPLESSAQSKNKKTLFMADPDAPFDSSIQIKPRQAVSYNIGSPDPKRELVLGLNQVTEAIKVHESYKAGIENNKDLNLGSGDILATDINAAVFAILDGLRDRQGLLTTGPDGIVLKGENADGGETAVDIDGVNLRITAGQTGINFSNSSSGEFMTLGLEVDAAGKAIFALTSTPLDVDAFTETFTDITDITLTNVYENILTGLLVNTYTADNSTGQFSFDIKNITNQNRTFQFFVTVDDGAPDNEVTVRISRDSTVSIANSVTLDFALLAGQEVQIKARELGTTGNLVTQGTLRPTTLKVSEIAVAANQIQFQRDIPSNSTLNLRTHEKIFGGSNHDLPVIIGFKPSRPRALLVSNDSSSIITIDGNGAGILTLKGVETSTDIRPSESFMFREESPTEYRVVWSHKDRLPQSFRAYESAQTINTTIVYIDKLDITETFDGGDYEIRFSFLWEMEVANRAIEVIIEIDAVQETFITTQSSMPTDSTTQGLTIERPLTPGVHTIKLRFRTTQVNKEARMAEAIMKITEII